MQIMGASVPGTRHTLPGSPDWKNNQDAYEFLELPNDRCVAVVCDGCSGGQFSEIGARLAAKKLVMLIADELSYYGPNLDDLQWGYIRRSLLLYLRAIAESMGPDIVSTIEQYFLFTIVGVVVTKDNIYVFSMGDGYYAFDGVFYELGPFPENKPPYLMYAACSVSALSADPLVWKFRITSRPVGEVGTILIGSDGVGDLMAAHTTEQNYPGTSKSVGKIERMFDPDFFDNPDNLRRHLALMNRETVADGKIRFGLLPDDTTVVMVRTKREDNKPITTEKGEKP